MKHSLFGLFLAVMAFAFLSTHDVTAQSAAPAVVGACGLPAASPVFVAMATSFGGVVIDEPCQYVYLTNTTQNRVEVYSLVTGQLETPIQVGAQPRGLDITPDGALLYVANSGGNNISVVDLAQRVELRKITVPPNPSNDRPFSIAIAKNGLALFTTTFNGSGFGGRMMQLVLATDQVSPRADFGFSGSTTEATRVNASADRSVIGIAVGNTSAGSVFAYSAAGNIFSPEKRLNTFISDVSLDLSGKTFLVTPGAYVLDAALSLSGTVVLAAGSGGNAVDPSWGLGYRPVASRVDVLNLSTFLKVGELPLGDTVNGAQLFNFVGRMDISANGALLAVITDNGFSIVRTFTTAPEGVNLVRNGDFSAGTNRWQTFATPDSTYIVSNVVGGVFEYFRVPPPPGTTNQAVVFHQTGIALPSGAPLFAEFDLGNSSSVRKRISVLLIDSDFSDLHVCTFWLPPNLPLTTYQMKTHTTKAWSNAAIYFYAATPGSDGGAYRIDNVSVEYDSQQAVDRTDCIDPTAPDPTGDPDGPNLLTNGDFGTGTVSPWILFGTITAQITAGVLEFIRPSATPPAGAVLQPTGQLMTAGELLTATFDLGNSSSVRKRVTVIVHDSDFSDLAACTFWLAPSQPLVTYAMRTFTTDAWTDAMLSVYPATTGAEQWIQLDNVGLRRTPSAAISGTECLEPGAVMLVPDDGRRQTGDRRVRHRAGAGFGAGRRQAIADGALVSGGSLEITAAADLPTAVTTEIDLTHATSARLSFRSYVRAAGAVGEVQIRGDRADWVPLMLVAGAEASHAVDLDLTAWLGQRIAIRFVLRSANPSTRDLWHVSDLDLAIGRDAPTRRF